MNVNSQLFEAALFPIPNMVCFPGNTIPLHVFEPRYRAMVKDCLRDNKMLAVSHVIKQVSSSKIDTDLQQVLSQNQASYESCVIFSAGDCELLKVMEDGRLYVQIKMKHRLKMLMKIQEVPYAIVRCELYQDDDVVNRENKKLQADINLKLLQISQQQSPKLYRLLKMPEWQLLSPQLFSFKIFKYIRFESDLMQCVLESKSITERLKIIKNRLKAVYD